MNFDLEESLAILERTPGTLAALLANAPAAWIRANEGPDTWSAFDIVGHLVCGEETDWIPRARIILESGESRAFDPFDRFAMIEASLRTRSSRHCTTKRCASIQAIPTSTVGSADIDASSQGAEPRRSVKSRRR